MIDEDDLEELGEGGEEEEEDIPNSLAYDDLINWTDLSENVDDSTAQGTRAVSIYGKKHIGRYRYEDISYQPIPTGASEGSAETKH